MQFQESDLQFRFDDQAWVLRKYDAHRFYRAISGSGLKGVDFIGIWKKDRLVLIEVKNYVNRHPRQTDDPAALDTVLLAQKVAQKARDTLKAIDIIHRYYRRLWWIRLWGGWLQRRSPRRYDWAFWSRVFTLAAEAHQVWIVLWLEAEGMPLELRQVLHEQLHAALDGTVAGVMVADRSQHPFGDTLQVNL